MRILATTASSMLSSEPVRRHESIPSAVALTIPEHTATGIETHPVLDNQISESLSGQILGAETKCIDSPIEFAKSGHAHPQSIPNQQ